MEIDLNGRSAETISGDLAEQNLFGMEKDFHVTIMNRHLI